MAQLEFVLTDHFERQFLLAAVVIDIPRPYYDRMFAWFQILQLVADNSSIEAVFFGLVVVVQDDFVARGVVQNASQVMSDAVTRRVDAEIVGNLRNQHGIGRRNAPVDEIFVVEVQLDHGIFVVFDAGSVHSSDDEIRERTGSIHIFRAGIIADSAIPETVVNVFGHIERELEPAILYRNIALE